MGIGDKVTSFIKSLTGQKLAGTALPCMPRGIVGLVFEVRMLHPVGTLTLNQVYFDVGRSSVSDQVRPPCIWSFTETVSFPDRMFFLLRVAFLCVFGRRMQLEHRVVKVGQICWIRPCRTLPIYTTLEEFGLRVFDLCLGPSLSLGHHICRTELGT